MQILARFIQQHSGAILIATILVSFATALPLMQLGYDDDVVRFLPTDDPEVQRFNKIVRQFGAINVALVGVEATHLYTAENLAYVRKLATSLKALNVVAHVTAMTELAVVDAEVAQAGEVGESVHRALVPSEIPTDSDALKRVQDGIITLDYLVGSVVSKDATSTLLVVQIYDEVDGQRISTTSAAQSVRKAAKSLTRPEDISLHFGGAPFIAEAAATGSQDDLKRLAPWVAGIIVLLIFLSLGSFRAAMLGLGSVGIGILWTLGIMAWTGFPLTLVSTSLPVVLVALGSAYAVHLLVCYLDHQPTVEGTLRTVGWPVLVAGLTTMAGFLSFLVMDLSPMREFGWQMAMGTGICVILALFVIPSFLYRYPIQGTRSSRLTKLIDDALVATGAGARRRRGLVLVLLVSIGLLFGSKLPLIETRMDIGSFFESDSAPAQADNFLTDKFSGSVFLQVLVEGDMTDPSILRQVAAFEDRIQAVNGVTRVESITNVLAIINAAFSGERRLATTTKGIKYHGYLGQMSDPAVSLLIDKNWKGALLQIALGKFDTSVVKRVTEEVRALASTSVPETVTTVESTNTELRAKVIDDAAERILLRSSAPEALKPSLIGILDAAGTTIDIAEIKPKIAKIIDLEIGEDEMIFVRKDTDLQAFSDLLSADMEAGRFTRKQFKTRLTSIADPEELEEPEAFDKSVSYLYRALAKLTDTSAATPIVRDILTLLGDGLEEAVKYRVSAIVHDVLAPNWAIDADWNNSIGAPLKVTVSGYPVVQEAMTQSVHNNQVKSLATSLPLVFLLLVLLFRSPLAGILGMIPTGLTLLVTFGLMGMFPSRFPLDIGSSMLASIALGVGIDYAIHFLWRYRETGADDAMRTTGRAIIINAVEITAGFIVLAAASLVPMSNFGILTAVTLLVAALATLILMPAVVELWKPRRQTGG